MRSRPKLVELFAGAGGMTLGAARAGFDVCGCVELDSRAVATHEKNFPKCEVWESDVAEIAGRDLRSRFSLRNGDLSGIIGGPPCQGFSEIGHRNATDPRNSLFVHFFRIVSEAKPLFFVAENVPGILAKSNNRLRNRALRQVQQDYNLLSPMLLKASDFGAPTTRTRVFFVGFRKGAFEGIDESAFVPKNIEPVNVNMALSGLPVGIRKTWLQEEDGWRIVRPAEDTAFGKRLQGMIPPGVGDSESIRRLRAESRVSGCLGTRHSPKVLERYRRLRAGEVDKVSKSRRLDPDGFCPTLRAGTGPERGSHQAIRPIHPTSNRVITPREAARLQGFPDWFRFAPDKWHSFMQIGNSVSPILAELILEMMRDWSKNV